MVNRAHELGGESVVVTFYPHPRQVLSHDSDIRFISTQEEKIRLLETLGAVKKGGIMASNHVGGLSGAFIPVSEDGGEVFIHQMIAPIICEGDIIGSVVLLEDDNKSKMGEVEQKLVLSAAGFLGKQMEQ